MNIEVESTKVEMKPNSKLLALSNDIAEYPPTNLTMHEWQTLIVLSSMVNSKERPIIGIDDIKEIAKERGLTTRQQQSNLLNDLVDAQRRYELSYEDFFSFYEGETPLTRQTKKDLIKAMQSLGSKTIITANSDERYTSFNWFAAIDIDKKNKYIKYVLSSVSQRLLMGLNKNFLQMMAKISINEAKKYDYPIFIYMKSKLHNKRDAYANKEELLPFKIRFGHDKIPSYTAWKDYHRRILKPAEDFAAKSGDIAYKFTGITTKGRKITHIGYKIWRIGNIHVPQLKGGEDAKKQRRNKWETIEASLTVQQLRGFNYLKGYDINHAFLLEECMKHKCMLHPVVVGYEDMFLKTLWSRFSTYTKASKKAGAFVSWWRTRKLTEGDHYYAVIDVLSQNKMSISQKEKDDRNRAAQSSKADYVEQRRKQKEESKPSVAKKVVTAKKKNKTESFNSIENILPSTKAGIVAKFDFKSFKKDYLNEFKKIEQEIFDRTVIIYGVAKESRGGVDLKKMKEVEKQVQKMLPEHCELWYKEHVLKGR